MTSTNRDVVSFSPKGDYLMHCSVDGILKVWDTRTGTLKTEYAPSSHLTATCKCLCWCPQNRFPDTSKKKKRKKAGDDAPSAGEDLGLVALGTTAGSVLLYSTIKGELHSRMENGHSDMINDICWKAQNNILYTCSSDKYLAEWDLTLAKIKHKWKASNGGLYSICLLSKNRLISAGNLIKLWDLKKYEVIMKYSGHTTEVFQLLPVIKNHQNFESSYFLSAAVNDRLVSAWSVNMNKTEKNAVASFSLPEEPIKLSLLNIKDQPIHLSVVTKGGQVLYFEHVLNGNMKKPLRPKLTIRVSSPSGSPFPILATYLSDDSDHSITVVHGSFLKPVFERVITKGASKEICLKHSESTSSVMDETNVQKVITGDMSKDVTILTPSSTIASGPVPNTSTSSAKKRKLTEFTMQERLNAISFDHMVEGPPTNNPPVADSMAVLLMQGLLSSDKNILNNVFLKNQNEVVIQNTVRKLDIQAIVPLIKELTQRMSGPSSDLHKYAQWIKVVLSIHTSYLISFPELMDNLSSLYQLLDARMAMFSKLTRLQGKLSLLLSQVKSREQEESEVQDQMPMLVYQDESSDEDMYLKKNLDEVVVSESDYDWNSSDDEAKDDSENTKSNNTDDKDESDD